MIPFPLNMVVLIVVGFAVGFWRDRRIRRELDAGDEWEAMRAHRAAMHALDPDGGR